MIRWSKIPEEFRPEIISDIFDDELYTLIVRNSFHKTTRQDQKVLPVVTMVESANRLKRDGSAFDIAYCSSCEFLPPNNKTFRRIIENNIPCVLMHKVKNKWTLQVDTLVCFMTGECNDVFLVHPRDLTKWNPDEVINH